MTLVHKVSGKLLNSAEGCFAITQSASRVVPNDLLIPRVELLHEWQYELGKGHNREPLLAVPRDNPGYALDSAKEAKKANQLELRLSM